MNPPGTLAMVLHLSKAVHRRSSDELLGMRLRQFLVLSYLSERSPSRQQDLCETLMLDANNAWRDLPTAIAYMERYERYDPYWIEEPFSPDEIDLHARFARSIATTVATGEIGYGRWYFKELLDKGGAEILQTDALVCGVISDGLITTQLPAAMAETTGPRVRFTGKFHGEMTRTTPFGS